MQHGSSKDVIQDNIKKLMADGKDIKEATALAYTEAERSKRNDYADMMQSFSRNVDMQNNINGEGMYGNFGQGTQTVSQSAEERKKDPEIDRVQGSQGAY